MPLQRHSSSRSRGGFPAVAILFFTSLFSAAAVLLSLTATAQSTLTAPPPNSFMQWAVLDEKTLYIQGGQYPTLYSLDLTKNFTDTNPPWTALASGPNTTGQSMVFNSDKTKLFVFDTNNKAIVGYTLATNQWKSLLAPSNNITAQGMAAVTDPDTNVVYIFNAYSSVVSASPVSIASTMAYSLTDGSVSALSTFSIPTNLFGYSAIWSTVWKSFLIYGGGLALNNQFGSYSSILYEYIPNYNMGVPAITTGTGPGPLTEHCMVSAYNGTKMILFGGQDITAKAVGTIYIMDQLNRTWVVGIPSTSPRFGMACAVAGDNFLAWGGQINNTYLPNTPIIYNMRMNQWVTQFVVPLARIAVSSTATNSTFTSKASRLGAIVGIVAAFVVAVAIGVFIFIRRKKSRGQSSSDDEHSGIEKTLENRRFDEGKSLFNGSQPLPSTASRLPLVPPPFHNPSPVNANTQTVLGYTPPPPVPPKAWGTSTHYPSSNPAYGQTVPLYLPQQGTAVFGSGGRNPQSSRYPQDGGVAIVSRRGYSSSSAPHALPPASARSQTLGAPQVLNPPPPQTLHQTISSHLTGSTSSSGASQTKSDLARRQLELIQFQHALNLEKLKVEQDLRLQQMEEELQ